MKYFYRIDGKYISSNENFEVVAVATGTAFGATMVGFDPGVALLTRTPFDAVDVLGLLINTGVINLSFDAMFIIYIY